MNFAKKYNISFVDADYDPRKWLLEGEKAMIERLRESFSDLNNLNTLI